MDVNKLRKLYPKGTIVRLIKMDDFQASPVGTLGKVEKIDDAGTIHVHWQNGSGLGLIPEEDEFEIINGEGEV